MRVGRTGRIIIGAAAALLIAAAVYLSYASFDVTSFKGAVSGRIEKLSGVSVEFERADLRVLPRPRLTIEGLALSHRGQEFLKVKTTSSTVNILPLLSGRFDSEPLVMDGAVLTIVREEDGTLNIEKIVPSGRFTFKSARVNDAEIRFSDLAIKKLTGLLFEKTLSDVNAQADFSAGWYEYRVIAAPEGADELTLSGRARKSGDKWEADGSIGATGASLDAFLPYLRAKSKDVSIGGVVDLVGTYRIGDKSTASGTLTYTDMMIGHGRAFASPVRSGKGAVSFDAAFSPGDIELRSAKARLFMEGFEANVLARARLHKDAPATIEVEASTTPAPVSSIKALLPTGLLSSRINDALNGISALSGTIELESLKLTGPIDSFDGFRILDTPGGVEASALVRGAGGRVSAPRALLSNVSAHVSLKDGVLIVQDLRGSYDGGVIKDLDARLYKLTSDGVYDVAMKASLDAGKTLAMLKELLKGDIAARLKDAKAKGRVDLSLRLKGSVKQKKLFDYKGEVSLSGFGLKHASLPVEIKSADGNARFDRTALFFAGLLLKDEWSSLKLDGSVTNWMTDNPGLDLKLEAKAHENTLRALLKHRYPDEARIDGPLDVEAEVKGGRDDLSVKLNCDMTGAAIGYAPLFIRKETWLPASLRASIRVQGDRLSVESSRLGFGSSEISAKGFWLKDLSAYDAEVESSGVRLVDLEGTTTQVSRLSGAMASRGELLFDIKAKKDGASERSVNGALGIKDALFISPYFTYPVELDASAKFTGNEASLKLEKLKSGESSIIAWARVKDIAKRVVEFEIYAPKARTEDLVPAHKRGEVSGATAWKDPFAGVTGSGSIKADELHIGPTIINDFKAEVMLTEKEAVASPIAFVKNEGTVNGSFTLFRTIDDPLLFKTSFRARGVDAKKFIGEFSPKSDILTGRLNGRVELEGKKGADPVQSGINGTAKLGAQSGKLWKFVLLSKIFSIVNILSIDELFKEGLPYEHIRGSFAVKDGVISTDNMFLNSDSLRMSAIGEIDSASWSIDAMLGMHPFVTIDRLISNIPIVGWIIGGREKSTISMYYDIDGPLADPVIEPVPAKSLIKGVDILQRLLETPIRLLVPAEED